MTLPSQGAAHGAVFGTLGFFPRITVGRKGLISKSSRLVHVGAQHAASRSRCPSSRRTRAWVLFTVPEAILGGPIAILGYALSRLPAHVFRSVAPSLPPQPAAWHHLRVRPERYGTVVNVYVADGGVLHVPRRRVHLRRLVHRPLWFRRLRRHRRVSRSSTSVGGLPVSLVTDRVQGMGVLIFTVLVVTAAIARQYPNDTDFATAQAASTMWATVTSWAPAGRYIRPTRAGRWRSF